jgi:hypothetical protein
VGGNSVTDSESGEAVSAETSASEHIIAAAPPEQAKQFPPSVKKAKAEDRKNWEADSDVPDGIFAQLTTECGGSVRDRPVEPLRE